MAKKKSSSTTKKTSTRKNRTKSEILSTIAEETGLAKKQVGAVMESLSAMMKTDMSKTGVFVLPGLLKAKVIRKPATKARKGVNPFTGEQTTFKAKPARNVVKIRPLKSLKESV